MSRLSLRFCLGIQLAGWLLLALLMNAPSVWYVPSFLPQLFPEAYSFMAGLLPFGWGSAPASDEAARSGVALGYLALIGLIWLGYGLALVALGARKPRLSLRLILAIAAFFWLLAFFWPGLLSPDLYGYALHGRQVLHGINPLIYPPNSLGADPLLQLTPWGPVRTFYGPLWYIVGALIALLAEAFGGQAVAYVLLYRLFDIVLLALGAWLVWDIGARLNWPQQRRVVATALFAWCPLLVIELVGDGHNDALLAVLVLAAVWLHLRGWWPLALATLIAAGLVKLPGFFFVPAYAVLLLRSARDRREAIRRAVVGLLVALLLILLLYLPFADPQLIALTLQNPISGFFRNSVPSFALRALIDMGLALRGSLTPAGLTERQALDALRTPLWYGPLVVWAALLLLISIQVRAFSGLARGWALGFFAYLVAAAWFWPWYISSLIAVVVLLPPGRLRLSGLLLALGGTLYYGVYPHLPGDTTTTLREYYTPLVIFGPALVYLAVSFIAQRRGAAGMEQPAPVDGREV